MAGWTVYVIEDPDLGRTNVVVRAQPWKRGLTTHRLSRRWTR